MSGDETASIEQKFFDLKDIVYQIFERYCLSNNRY